MCLEIEINTELPENSFEHWASSEEEQKVGFMQVTEFINGL